MPSILGCSPKNYNMKDNLEIAYLAGFFDGEGGINVHRRRYVKKLGGESIYYILRVDVANTDKQNIYRLKDLFGGCITLRKKQDQANQAVWAWQITTKKAQDFLRAVYPYLRVKRKQAETAMQFEIDKTNQKSRVASNQERQEQKNKCEHLHKLNRPWSN